MRGGHAVLTSEPRAGRARRLARAPLPRGFSRVRDRLLAALFVLLCSAVLLTVGGWAGIRRTQDALVDVQEDILPEISNAMALVEQSSQLVSAIPKLVESASPAQLAMQRESAESLLALIDQRARELRTPPEDLRYVISRLRDGLGRSLPELTQRTQQKLVAEGGLAADLATLNELDRSFDTTAPDAPPLDPRLRPLWSSLVQGAMATDEPTIGRLEADVEVQAHRLQDAGLLDTLSPAQRDALARLAAGPRSILAYRHELIRLKADISYLDALSAADAGNLREEMARYVAELRRSAAGRSALVRAKTHDNELLMLGLTLLCITISGMATHYVGRLVREIENIARLMTRLAKGHTDQATPAIARSDELGELARSFDVFREILLAKQQLLRDLNAQRELLETVHQSLTDGLAVFDEHDRLRLWNRRLADMLAGPGARLSAGATPRELFAALPGATRWRAESREPLRPLGDPAAAAWTQHDYVELHTPAGVVLELRSCRMPGGGLVTLATDATARRSIEQQLQQAQKLEVLGQLTGGVAHDFNNYLGTILGNLALLETSVGEDSPARVQWQRVRRAAASAAGLTRRLLAFARKQPLQAEDVRLDDMVEEMRDLVEYSAGPAIEIALALDAPGIDVHLDRGQLENAVLNLALNSAAAMPGGGRLVVATRRLPHPGADASGPASARVELSVEDTGVGMTEEQLARAFEPFYSTRPAGQGSGLGLSIVYGFVRQSGGEIELHSRPGAGTRVALRFPAVERSGASAEAGAEAPASPSAPAPSIPRTLLLVDDDAAFRDTLAEQLQRLGHVVHAATGAEPALAALEGGLVVQGVISDVRLGAGVGGVGLAQRLRERWPATPVLLMSGEVPELALGALAGSATPPGARAQFLQKPFTLGQLGPWLDGLPVPAAAPD